MPVLKVATESTAADAEPGWIASAIHILEETASGASFQSWNAPSYTMQLLFVPAHSLIEQA